MVCIQGNMTHTMRVCPNFCRTNNKQSRGVAIPTYKNSTSLLKGGYLSYSQNKKLQHLAAFV